jgi:hypothetical protein
MDAIYGSDEELGWGENDGGQNFAIHTIATGDAVEVFAVDMDGDGDLDVLAAYFSTGKLAWYEQLDVDFGDAPAPYPTLFVENGARHWATGPTLGRTEMTTTASTTKTG